MLGFSVAWDSLWVFVFLIEMGFALHNWGNTFLFHSSIAAQMAFYGARCQWFLFLYTSPKMRLGTFHWSNLFSASGNAGNKSCISSQILLKKKGYLLACKSHEAWVLKRMQPKMRRKTHVQKKHISLLVVGRKQTHWKPVCCHAPVMQQFFQTKESQKHDNGISSWICICHFCKCNKSLCSWD